MVAKINSGLLIGGSREEVKDALRALEIFLPTHEVYPLNLEAWISNLIHFIDGDVGDWMVMANDLGAGKISGKAMPFYFSRKFEDDARVNVDTLKFNPSDGGYGSLPGVTQAEVEVVLKREGENILLRLDISGEYTKPPESEAEAPTSG